MKKIYISLVFSLILSTTNFSQNAVDCAVQIGASIQLSPPTITLSWVGNATTTNYNIYRKLKTGTNWGFSIAALSGTVNQYVDNTVSSGVSYEYKIVRTGSGYNGWGYINAGMEIAETADRGKLILMIDSAYVSTLSNEIKRLQDDLEGDGWKVLTHYVSNLGSVTHVRSLVQVDYNLDPTNTRALFIFGHVPVPYSGNINPDGHPDHLGAWPTDSYYGDVNGTWTDVSVNTTTPSPLRTQNIPGDGKFDQSVLPSGLELQVGRVDFRNMPTFTLTEQQLLKNYLDKDHDYRKKVFTVTKQAVVDDNFGYMSGEAFAASGYNNFAGLVGSSSVTAGDYFTSMTGTASCLWAYGCGGGTYNSAGGIGATSNFASANLQGVFSMLFGSYFGDWDSQDNFLRAPLAQGKILTNIWSGRPHVQFHHMALGENIGYGMWLTQNYQGPLYFPNIYNIQGSWVHMGGLMGDPTLRNDVVAPVSNVVATRIGNNCNVSWSASTQTNIIGYNIYMKNDTNKNYVKINANPIAGTTYTDVCMLYPGIYKYMVRALKLENTASGTYYNLSEGIADTALNTNYLIVKAQFSNALVTNTVTFTNTSTNATASSWTLGNGAFSNVTNPVGTYTANGSYTVTLIASNGCDADTTTTVININAVGLKELNLSSHSFNFYPNPANTEITLSNDGCENCSIVIYNYEGKQVYNKTNVSDKVKINVTEFNRGLYLIKLVDKENKSFSKRLVID